MVNIFKDKSKKVGSHKMFRVKRNPDVRFCTEWNKVNVQRDSSMLIDFNKNVDSVC